jgi:PPOX class probable F420-dependent enzyme
MPDDLDRLATAKYLLLTTFRKDGTAVPTPVWVARDGDELVLTTGPNAGKVKRIRRDNTVRVAPCTMRGKPTGAEVPAHARVVDAADVRHVQRLIARKYWVLGRIGLWNSQLRPNARPGAIAITLDQRG